MHGLEHLGGVYKITNLRNGKFYIGSAEDFTQRWAQHIRDLRRGANNCTLLQRAYTAEKDKSVFVFEEYIICREEDNLFFEQQCLDVLKPPYNIVKKTSRGPIFSELPEAAQENLRASRKQSMLDLGENNPMLLMNKDERSAHGHRGAKTRRLRGTEFFASENNPNFTMSKEQLLERGRKACATRDARGTTRRTPVVELTEGKVFPSIRAAERYYDAHGIGEVCRGNRKSAGGRRFAFIDKSMEQ